MVYTFHTIYEYDVQQIITIIMNHIGSVIISYIIIGAYFDVTEAKIDYQTNKLIYWQLPILRQAISIYIHGRYVKYSGRLYNQITGHSKPWF